MRRKVHRVSIAPKLEMLFTFVFEVRPDANTSMFFASFIKAEPKQHVKASKRQELVAQAHTFPLQESTTDTKHFTPFKASVHLPFVSRITLLLYQAKHHHQTDEEVAFMAKNTIMQATGKRKCNICNKKEYANTERNSLLQMLHLRFPVACMVVFFAMNATSSSVL